MWFGVVCVWCGVVWVVLCDGGGAVVCGCAVGCAVRKGVLCGGGVVVVWWHCVVVVCVCVVAL